MRARGVALLATVLLSSGCGGDESDKQSQASPSPSPATTAASTSASPEPSQSGSDIDFALSAEICTDGIGEPDALVLDATHAARAGTRSVSEIADAIREAQNAVEDLAGEAEGGGFQRLADSLQAYADVLGRARVTGDVGLTEIADAREQLNIACLTPAFVD